MFVFWLVLEMNIDWSPIILLSSINSSITITQHIILSSHQPQSFPHAAVRTVQTDTHRNAGKLKTFFFFTKNNTFYTYVCPTL